MAGLYTEFSVDLGLSLFLDALFELNPAQFARSALSNQGNLEKEKYNGR
jgi:hypothetical protein